MERRHFLKLGLAFAASGVLVAKTLGVAAAAPLPPLGPTDAHLQDNAPQPAVAGAEEVEHLKPEPVRWHRRWGWHRRHWHRHHWHRPWRRHWGWHRHRGWRRHAWRRRYW